jgi:hypothetical protein
VVALCRTHHRLFDSGRLALAPYLLTEVEQELRHALTHVGRAAVEAALSGDGWPAPWSAESISERNGERA